MLNLLLLCLFIPFACSLYLKSHNIFKNMPGRCRQLRAILLNDDTAISKAAHMLKVGELVAFPTETVYGLGANAFNETAVYEVFRMKGRPRSDPLIVHVASADMMHNLFDFNSDHQSIDSYNNSNYAVKVCTALSTAFWPGPLTLVYKANARVPSIVCANTGHVGIRCPKHPLAMELLKAADVPVAAPSANRFGHISPTCAQHVLHDLGACDIAVLGDDPDQTGGCTIGVESTVCRVSADGRCVNILRCGAVTVSMIGHALREAGLGDCCKLVHNKLLRNTDTALSGNTEQQQEKEIIAEVAVSPGHLIRHYSPDIPTYIKRSLPATVATSPAGNTKVCNALVIDFGGQLQYLRSQCRHYIDLSSSGDCSEACAKLFSTLRYGESVQMRSLGVTCILLPDLSNTHNSGEAKKGLIDALWERLHRAAAGIFL